VSAITEADALLQQWGKNELREKSKSKLRILFEQARQHFGRSHDAHLADQPLSASGFVK
jgi:Flp pilus assembly protein TadD